MNKIEIVFDGKTIALGDDTKISFQSPNPSAFLTVPMLPDPVFDKFAEEWAAGLSHMEIDKPRVMPKATMTITCTETHSPVSEKIREWLGMERDTTSMAFVMEGPVDAQYNVNIAESESVLLPGEIYHVPQSYSFEGSFQPEPRLEIPYKLKWHSHGVNVVGADGQVFQEDFFDGVFRSGRIARQWAKHKVKVQDTKIVGRVGTMHGVVFHTGAPKE